MDKKKIPLKSIIYWVLVLLTAVVGHIQILGSERAYESYLYIGIFGIIFYLCLVCSKRLSKNFITKNHKTTPLLSLPAVVLFAYYVWFTDLRLSVYYMEILKQLSFIVFIFLLISALTTMHSTGILNAVYVSLTVLSFSVWISFILAGYFLISFMYEPIIAGVIVAAAWLIFNIILKNKDKANRDGELEKAFGKYLDRVFKRVPFSDEMTELRQQLSEKLHWQAERLKQTEGMYSIYGKCVESLGDFSDLLRPYKKNIAARFSFTNNMFIKVFLAVLVAANIVLVSVMSMPKRNGWELLPFTLGISVLFIFTMIVLRLINQVRLKEYRFMPLLISFVILLVSALGSMFWGLEHHDDEGFLLRALLIEVGALAVVAAGLEFLLYRREKRAG